LTPLLRCFAAWCRCLGLCSTSQRSSRTTGKRLFVVCLNFCRVFFFGHMANALFAVCLVENTRQIKYTRQTVISPCAEAPAHGEAETRAWHVLPPSGSVARADGRQRLLRAQRRTRRTAPFAVCPISGTRQKATFAVCHP